jgi:dTDP-4-dehydrorhamnose reductase
MMRILLTGANGQLGWELQRSLSTLGSVIGVDLPEYDLAQPDRLLELVRQVRPQVIVNPAAYTDVDKAEQEHDLAHTVNGVAPGLLAQQANEIGAAIIHYSTDYVFNGSLGRPYSENDQPGPLNAYGRSKLVGEQAVQQVGDAFLILRTSWVYSLRGNSFVNKVLRWSRSHRTLRIVNDQVSNPTWARALAEATGQLLAQAGSQPAGWIRERRGLYHLAAPDWTSRFEWAQAILSLDPHREQQVVQEVLPASSAEFPTPAVRPAFSALDCSLFSKTFDLQLPHWRDALRLSLTV